MTTATLHLVSLSLYALSAALLGVSMARSDRRLPGIAATVLAAAIVAHLAELVVYAREFHELPLVGLGPSLSVFALLIAAGSLGLATVGRTGPVGLVLVPVAAAVAAIAEIVGVRPSRQVMDFQGPWFVFHVVLAFVGYAGLTVAFAAGLMYLIQFRELKSKRFGAIFRFFPPLDTLDRIGRGGLIAGMSFLTLALLVGWAWTERFGHPMSPGNPKVVWGILSWLVFAAALASRAGGGRPARRAALASVVGFAVVIFGYVVLRMAESGGGAFL
ncbi:cytochrome C assembly family protein [Longimicrobium sp.]|uniref:cytochrome C assembly family protein n=1 Tax=Longimicrobium sp. TaxID=2029185 RepID=UPI002CCFA7A2|nr:cytochrome c biogenesis protein CcsA [Longimicrobium sp.]HSU13368.1 cytochrome c biogenesis protein CcsA [Longimicrobium sp.]